MKSLTRSIITALGVLASGMTFAGATQDTEKPMATPEAPIGVPEYFDIAPQGEVLDAVRQVMGGTVDESAQTDNAIKMYEHARQVTPEVDSIVDTFTVRLHSDKKYAVQVVSGYESEIVFFDLNGKPWEIGDVSTGNTTILQATKNEVMPHSIVLAAGEGQYAGRTNIKVRFAGLDTSISFPITINTQAYIETLKVVLPGMAPAVDGVTYNPSFDERRVMDDPIARAILDNPVAPENSGDCASRLAITKTLTGQTLPGIQPAVFSCDNGLYIRTRYLSAPAPEPNGVTHGPDGYRVYHFIDSGEYFSFRDRAGQPVFVEAVKPQTFIGARFGEGATLK